MDILGLFKHADTMLDAAKRLESAGYAFTVYSPVPLVHEIDHEFGERKSYIKYFTFFGGLSGFFTGTLLALGTAALYVLPRGGRPIFFITPTLIISYETTILFGVGITLLSFLLFAGLPSFKKDVPSYEVAIDSFGLLVDDVREDEFVKLEKILREYGADEVKRVEED